MPRTNNPGEGNKARRERRDVPKQQTEVLGSGVTLNGSGETFPRRGNRRPLLPGALLTLDLPSHCLHLLLGSRCGRSLRPPPTISDKQKFAFYPTAHLPYPLSPPNTHTTQVACGLSPPNRILIRSRESALAGPKRVGAFAKWDQGRVREPAGGDAEARAATRGRHRKRKGETKEQRAGVRGVPLC